MKNIGNHLSLKMMMWGFFGKEQCINIWIISFTKDERFIINSFRLFRLESVVYTSKDQFRINLGIYLSMQKLKENPRPQIFISVRFSN